MAAAVLLWQLWPSPLGQSSPVTPDPARETGALPDAGAGSGTASAGVPSLDSPDPRGRVLAAGRVFDGGGSPIRGAELLLEGPGGAAAATVTDAEGRFGAYLSPPSLLYRAAVTAEGFLDVSFEDLPSDQTVVLHLRRDVVLAGRAVYAGGGAVERYALELRPVNLDPTEVTRPAAEAPGSAVRRATRVARTIRPRQLEVSDPEGRFELRALAPGTYRLIASTEQGARGESTVNLGANGAGDVTLELVRGGTVRGLVRAAETGEPVANAEVALGRGVQGPRTRCDRDGRFEIAAVPAGRYQLVVSARGFRELQRWDLIVEEGDVLDLGDLELSSRQAGSDRPQVRFGGIGARLGGKRGQVTIAGVEPGGPAELEGLQDGDRILTIDGMPAQHMRPGEVARKIRGTAGQAVTLEVERDGERLRFTLVREAIEMDLPVRRRGKRK